MPSVPISASNEAQAVRSLLYASLSAAFDYPREQMLDAVRSGDFAGALRQLLMAIDPRLAADTDWAALQDAGAVDDALPEEYTRLFIAGADGPACAMEEAAYHGNPLEAMEEAIRFYRFFGLALPTERQGQPDHLVTQLEFLHYLAYQEARAESEGGAPDALLRAQRDFIGRHPGAWVPRLRTQLVTSRALPFFLELTRLLERVLNFEARRLQERVGAQTPEADGERLLHG